MRRLLPAWLILISDSRAVTALEYGMIAALIAAVIATAVAHLGMQTNTLWVKANSIL